MEMEVKKLSEENECLRSELEEARDRIQELDSALTNEKLERDSMRIELEKKAEEGMSAIQDTSRWELEDQHTSNRALQLEIDNLKFYLAREKEDREKDVKEAEKTINTQKEQIKRYLEDKAKISATNNEQTNTLILDHEATKQKLRLSYEAQLRETQDALRI